MVQQATEALSILEREGPDTSELGDDILVLLLQEGITTEEATTSIYENCDENN